MLSSLAVLSPLDPKSVNAFVHAVLRRVIYKEPEEALPLDLILQLLDSLYEDPASQEAQQGKRDVFEAVAKVLALAGTEKWYGDSTPECACGIRMSLSFPFM